MPGPPPIVLASRSPRRRRLLHEAGIEVIVRPSDLDDGDLLAPAGVSPREWVMALAYFKARRVALLLDADRDFHHRNATILAADTVCAHDGRILGQPSDAEMARDMLYRMRDDTHVTLTGVCLLFWSADAESHDDRVLMVDEAVVHLGALPDQAIETYVSDETWRGKAGGYNLADRLDAGWPIECEGDPTTVMGLPMQRLARPLASLSER